MAGPLQIVIAARDPDTLARFWAAALVDYVLQPPPDGYETWEQFADEMHIPPDRRNDLAAIVDPGGAGPRILFERWEPDPPGKRVHLDINAVGAQVVSDDARRSALASERKRLEALGARFEREATGMAGEIWIEMYDPEGNWFCVQ